ncbi:hypothetical protein Tco_0194101 [Tanacetum coccineum]
MGTRGHGHREEQTNPLGLRENYIRCRSRRVLRKAHKNVTKPIMADKYVSMKEKEESWRKVKRGFDFGDAVKKSTSAQVSAYSDSRNQIRQEDKDSSQPGSQS